MLDLWLTLLRPWLLGLLLTGCLARSYGRSFWRWARLGAVLPCLSVFVVMLAVYPAARAEEQDQPPRSE